MSAREHGARGHRPRRWQVPAAGIVTTASAVAAPLLRRRLLRWGATPVEAGAELPGDHLVPDADVVATRGITVHAAPERVWPWLAQLGQGRGGFYSYDRLENLMGCDIHSSANVVEAWQQVAPGDEFRLHPDVALRIAQVDPPWSLVVRGGVAPDGRATLDDPAAPYDFTWSFVTRMDGDGGTRLVVRERYGCRTWWARPMVEVVSVASWVMTQRMLRGIRDRAQGGTAPG